MSHWKVYVDVVITALDMGEYGKEPPTDGVWRDGPSPCAYSTPEWFIRRELLPKDRLEEDYPHVEPVGGQ